MWLSELCGCEGDKAGLSASTKWVKYQSNYFVALMLMGCTDDRGAQMVSLDKFKRKFYSHTGVRYAQIFSHAICLCFFFMFQTYCAHLVQFPLLKISRKCYLLISFYLHTKMLNNVVQNILLYRG